MERGKGHSGKPGAVHKGVGTHSIYPKPLEKSHNTLQHRASLSTAPATLSAQKRKDARNVGSCTCSSQSLVCTAGEKRDRHPGPSSSILFSLRVRGDEEGPGSPPPSCPPPTSLHRTLVLPHDPAAELSSLPPRPQSSPGNLTSTQGLAGTK